MIVLWVISILVVVGAGILMIPLRSDNGRIFAKIFCCVCLALVLVTLILMGVQLWWKN